MKKIRLLFYILILILTSGFSTCGKISGVQVNSYVLSSCPNHDYKIPNLAETDALIFTQSDVKSIVCSDFKYFTVMNKEKIDNKPEDIALQIERKDSNCVVKFLKRRFCRINELNCLEKNPKIHPTSFEYDFKDLLPKFLFNEKKITVVKEADPIIITGNEFKNLCKWEK